MTKDERLLFGNSIERVINTTVRLLNKYVPDTEEDLWVNLEDWGDLKFLVIRLWNEARNEAFIRNQKEVAK